MKSLLAFLTTTFVATSLFAAEGYRPWDEDVVDSFSRIPVQHEGRIKPLHTAAHFFLLQLNGVTNVKAKPDIGGEQIKLSAQEWVMDLWFRPEFAHDYPVFLVDDSDAVVAIGVQAKKKRDRYSYNELQAGRQKLAELASNYAQKSEEERTALEGQIMLLGRRVNMYELFASTMLPADPSHLIKPELVPEEMRKLADTVVISELIDKSPEMSMQQIAQMMGPQLNSMSEDERTFAFAMNFLRFLTFSSSGDNPITPRFFPPQEAETEDWLTPGDLVKMAVESKEERPWALERLRLLEGVARNVDSPAKFAENVAALNKFIDEKANARDEAKQIGAEVMLYEYNLRLNSTILFFISFMLVALSWLSPKGKPGKALAWGSIGIGTIALAVLMLTMTLRSMIRGWAYVTNLYETFLFIAAIAFILGVFVEWIVKNRVGLSVGTFIAATCLYLSGQFIAVDRADTLPPLVAVLRSNFWLLIHVKTIVAGYGAGLLAAVIAHFYVVGKSFGIAKDNRKAYKTIAGMAYGIALFSLFFSLLGTILGGIWANYSWGRFWGWDPKENGALMIVLWTLVILHARLGGYFRQLGICMATIFLGVIISFSWFGVNALGEGLHSYGFAEGIMRALYIFWALEGIVFALGVAAFFKDTKVELRPLKAALTAVCLEYLLLFGALLFSFNLAGVADTQEMYIKAFLDIALMLGIFVLVFWHAKNNPNSHGGIMHVLLALNLIFVFAVTFFICTVKIGGMGGTLILLSFLAIVAWPAVAAFRGLHQNTPEHQSETAETV